jgi:DNA-binding NarL/FixJ family response regulator
VTLAPVLAASTAANQARLDECAMPSGCAQVRDVVADDMCKQDDMSAHLNNDSIRILVVDDHELFRIGLRQLLESEGFEVADADCAEAALRRLRCLSPDVVVMGVNLPGASGVEATRLVREAALAAAVVVLAIVPHEEHVLQTLKAGAVGYLLKDSELAQIVAGIRSAAAGHSALSSEVARILIDHIRRGADDEIAAPSPEPRDLSERERQVLSLLASGCDNSQIGEVLFVSRSTVKNHVSRVFEKLEVDNRVQAAAYAIRNGLVDADPRSN